MPESASTSGKAIYEHALHQVVEHLADSPRDYPAWAAPLVAAHVAMSTILQQLLDLPADDMRDRAAELLDIVAPAVVIERSPTPMFGLEDYECPR